MKNVNINKKFVSLLESVREDEFSRGVIRGHLHLKGLAGVAQVFRHKDSGLLANEKCGGVAKKSQSQKLRETFSLSFFFFFFLLLVHIHIGGQLTYCSQHCPGRY